MDRHRRLILTPHDLDLANGQHRRRFQFDEQFRDLIARCAIKYKLGSAPTVFRNCGPMFSSDFQFDMFENHKYIQQQLFLLRHAHSCRKREIAATEPNYRCSERDCVHMKTVFTHLSACTAGNECTFTHCYLSKKILTHWMTCAREDCPVCGSNKEGAFEKLAMWYDAFPS